MTPQMMAWVHTPRADPLIEASLLMVGLVLLLSLLVISLAYLGRRAIYVSRGLVMVAVMLLAGCGTAGEPEEIWCGTGNGGFPVRTNRAHSRISVRAPGAPKNGGGRWPRRVATTGMVVARPRSARP